MKILALDTATEACSVALGLGDESIARYLELPRGHAEQILSLIDEVLAEGGVKLHALDAIAFGRGPGSFTGVRLAASVAQGLAFGAGLGVVAVSTLAAVAERARHLAPQATRVLVVNDARMREVYWAEFEIRRGQLAMNGTEQVTPPEGVTLPELPGGAAWAAAGRGLAAYPALAERCSLASAVVLPDLLPRAAEVLALARPEVAAGRLLRAHDAVPVYVRDRVAKPMV